MTQQDDRRPSETPAWAWEDEDAISIADLVRTLYSYKRFLVLTIGGVAVVTLAVGTLLYVMAPGVTTARVDFELHFDGVEQNQYPNGTRFSTEEFSSTPVLNKVYRQNNLKDFFSGFSEFANAVFVVNSNPALMLLDEEYRAKLADTKLSATDRQRLEDEYRAKRQAVQHSALSLNLTLDDAAGRLPASLVKKILPDILHAWAEVADEQKGALRYRTPVFSRNIIENELVQNEDYIVAVDILRAKINNILKNITELKKIPGVELVRVGEDNLSLAEIEDQLNDILRYKLQPLVGMIRASGLSKDPASAALYFENRLFDIQLQQQELSQRVETLQNALERYMREQAASPPSAPGPRGSTALDPSMPALIPQFGESFLDRLIEMASRSGDQAFRQGVVERIIEEGMEKARLDRETKYYEDLAQAVQQFSSGRSAGRTQVAETVLARMEEMTLRLGSILDHLGMVHREVSEQHLDPGTQLYTATSPVDIAIERTLPGRTVALYSTMILFLTVMLALGAVFVHHAYLQGAPSHRERPTESTAFAQSDTEKAGPAVPVHGEPPRTRT